MQKLGAQIDCGSLQLLDWNGGMERWNGIVECVLQGERSLLMQFPTVAVLFLIEFVTGPWWHALEG